MKISRIKHEAIDVEAYNRCIESSPFGVVYAMSWYLDGVCPQWELLMADDYGYVMPLPVKQKAGIRYLIQPLFCQQLGVFGTQPVTEAIFEGFIRAIPYSFYHLQLNAGNLFNYAYSHIKDNFVLDLHDAYADIGKKYRKNFVRNIRKAEKENLWVETDTDWDTFLQVVGNNCVGRPIARTLNVFSHLTGRLRESAAIEIWSVGKAKREVLSSVFFIRWRDTIYYTLPVSTPEGKEKQSMSFLLDRFLRNYSGQALVLDFEGSSIPGIARFYQSIGAVERHYPVVTRPEAVFGLWSFVKNSLLR
jgi:hypothetical protein